MEDYEKTLVLSFENICLCLTLLLIFTLETSGKIAKLGETGSEHWLKYQVCAHSSGESKTFKPFPLSSDQSFKCVGHAFFLSLLHVEPLLVHFIIYEKKIR